MVPFVHFSTAKRPSCLNKEPGFLSPLLRQMFRCMLYVHAFRCILCVYTDSGVFEHCYNSHRCVPACCINFLFVLFSSSFWAKPIELKEQVKMWLTDNAVLSGWSRGAVRAPHTEHFCLYSVAEVWAYLPHNNFLSARWGLSRRLPESKDGESSLDSPEVLYRYFREWDVGIFQPMLSSIVVKGPFSSNQVRVNKHEIVTMALFSVRYENMVLECSRCDTTLLLWDSHSVFIERLL